MKRKAEFMMRNIGGDKLLVPLGAQVLDINCLIVLNDTGAFVWELLAQERSVDEISVAVAEKFDVATNAARTDVQSFADEITKMGLLEL